MKAESILRSDLLDILFEGRNKSYGAYALRREYPKELMKSLSVISLILISLLLYSFLKKPDHKGTIREHSIPDPIIVKFADAPKPVEPSIKKPPAVKHTVATVPNRVPHIVPDPLASPKTPSLDQLKNHAIGDSAIEGPPSSINSNPSPISNTGKIDAKDTANAQPSIITSPDIAPEFPGGTDGWIRFLKKNLRPKESDEQYKVTVIVNFVVNEDGTLSELQVSQSGGADLDSEVMRVMKKSPKWNAGVFHGKKVKVYHSQPVTFVNQSDE